MAKLALKVLLLLALPLALAVGSAHYHPRRPGWDLQRVPGEGEVSLQKALGWGSQALWLDARSRKAYQRQHVPGAMLLNEDDWESLMMAALEAWAPDRPLVVYCSRECQSSHAVAERLKREAGLQDVYVLAGGWEAWRYGTR